MKLILDKLGRIEHAELDIRPLTVLVGENNTNKTWAAYCLYGIARYLTWRESSPLGETFGHGFLALEPADARESIDAAVREVLERALYAPENAVQFTVARRQLIRGINSAVRFAFSAERIRDLLRLKDELSDESSAVLEVDPAEFQRSGLTGMDDVSALLDVEYFRRSVKVHLAAPGARASFTWQPKPDAEVGPALNERAADVLRALAHRFLAPGMALALPSERKSFVSTYKLLKPEFEEVLSRPVVELANFLSLTEVVWQGRQEPAMSDALAHLQGKILSGSIQLMSAGAGRRLVFAPRAGPALPLHSSSSMIRALAGLDLYLRCWAAPGDFLILDEPEMNAHPEAQVRLTEFLAYLVNRGIRVVLTTHSPYIADHLNNLIRAKDLSGADQTAIAPHFKLGTADCFLCAEDVSAYLFQADGDKAPVTVSPIFDREERHLINWETFGRTTEYVTNLYSAEILARLYR
ncbi:AAA family ATPase [Sorangium sp. So ce1389]|uniref:AAA family ATPase n=1 Tax=Sorangium sp. So ce1389 TaxID=3133336 RepID=UPI003F6430D5